MNIHESFSYLPFYRPELEAKLKEYRTVSQSSGGDINVLEEYIERRKARTLERLKVCDAVCLTHSRPHSTAPSDRSFQFHSAVVKWARDREQARNAARISRAIDGLHRIMADILAMFDNKDW